MKHVYRVLLGVFLLVGLAHGQMNTLVQTSLASAVNDRTTATINLTSATGVTISAQVQTVFLVDGELMLGQALSGTVVTVQRGFGATPANAHPSGSIVLIGRPDWFGNFDPEGACTKASTYVTPFINITSGNQWLCSDVVLRWVPGFGNPGNSQVPPGPTTAVASAGTILPSGPLFHVTGAVAIATITVPVGFQNGGTITIVFDGVDTWTAAGNISVAGTNTTAGSAVSFYFDSNTAKWVPSRLA